MPMTAYKRIHIWELILVIQSRWNMKISRLRLVSNLARHNGTLQQIDLGALEKNALVLVEGDTVENVLQGGDMVLADEEELPKRRLAPRSRCRVENASRTY